MSRCACAVRSLVSSPVPAALPIAILLPSSRGPRLRSGLRLSKSGVATPFSRAVRSFSAPISANLPNSATISSGVRRGSAVLNGSARRTSSRNSGGAEAYEERSCSLKASSAARSLKPSAWSSLTLASNSRSSRSRRVDWVDVEERCRPRASICARSSAERVASEVSTLISALASTSPDVGRSPAAARPAPATAPIAFQSSIPNCARKARTFSSSRTSLSALRAAPWSGSRRRPAGPSGSGPALADGAVPFHSSRSAS